MARKRKALNEPAEFPDKASAKKYLRSLDLPSFTMRTLGTEVEHVNNISPQQLPLPKGSLPTVNIVDTDQTSSTIPTNNKSIATSSKPTFLTLPSEIRQEIYDHLFSDTMEAFVHIGEPCYVRPTGFPITQVSKAIRAEALHAAWYHLSLRICWGELESWYANSLVLLDLEQEFPSLERLIMEDRSMRRPNGPEETWSEIIIEDCRKFLHFDPYRKPSSDGPQFDDNISRLQHDATRSYELIYIYELRPHMPITGRLVEDFKMYAEVSLDAGTVKIKKTPLTREEPWCCVCYGPYD